MQLPRNCLLPTPLTPPCLRSLSCSVGGVVVTSTDGRVVCNNTLDARLEIAYQQNLPAVRAVLFGKEAAVR